MEKDLFIEVLQHYSKCSEGEALKVLSLKESFPYCQLLHTLSARLSKDHGLVDQSRELQLAAVYAADRAVLKDVMTLDNIVVEARYKPPAKPAGKDISITRAVTAPVTTPAPAQEMAAIVSGESAVIKNELQTPVIHEDDPETGTMAEQVLHDLEKLHQLKHNFEMMFVDGGANEIKISTEKITGEASVIVEAKESLEESQQAAKSKKERIIELARALEASKKNETSEEGKTT
ncbi:MAG: hypothetical protein C0490_28035, partial [Marivirga sp.]|nr:hypothetical protein [Marivirga sp.]